MEATVREFEGRYKVRKGELIDVFKDDEGSWAHTPHNFITFDNNGEAYLASTPPMPYEEYDLMELIREGEGM